MTCTHMHQAHADANACSMTRVDTAALHRLQSMGHRRPLATAAHGPPQVMGHRRSWATAGHGPPQAPGHRRSWATAGHGGYHRPLATTGDCRRRGVRASWMPARRCALRYRPWQGRDRRHRRAATTRASQTQSYPLPIRRSQSPSAACVCVCTHALVPVHTCAIREQLRYACTPAQVQTWVQTHVRLYMYARMLVCPQVCLQTCVCACTHTVVRS